MCGIAGKLWLDSTRPADAETVSAMAERLTHRGPDDGDVVSEGPVAFGHRRLSIVDLSKKGRQPMTSHDGTCLLVVNGEIYNHEDLREELTARGHTFRSRCDSEVLLPLYQEYFSSEGPACFDRIEGMYAFALWDQASRRLILGRDRTGQKPLVWGWVGEEGNPDGLVFASELEALLPEPGLDRRPDWDALSDYLAFRVVPHPRSAWRGVSKLPPATIMVVEEGKARTERIWRLAPGSDETAHLSFEEAAEGVRDRFEQAVRRRLMSDVPLGVLLSGGTDSAAIVAAMSRVGSGPIKTFTIGFEEAAWDESARARAVANHFETEHHEEILRPDAVGLLDDLLHHYGEPFADSSALPTFLVSRLAREQVKVALTGDGADESFAGYDRYRALHIAERLSGRAGMPVRLALRCAAGLISPFVEKGHRAPGTRLQRLLGPLDSPPRHRNHIWRLGMEESFRERLLTREGKDRFGEPTHYGANNDLPLRLNEALVLDHEHYLPDDILVKVDIASMAHGLEARSPFLDRELMDYTAALPGSYKLTGDAWKGGGSKAVLKEALRPMLPKDMMSGPKRGFGVPLDAWFRGPLRDHAREILLSPEACRRGLFSPDAVGVLLEGHAKGRVAAHETLFTLLCLERWFLRQDALT